MEKFIRSIRNIYPLSDADLNTLLNEGEEIHVPKGTRIVSVGEINRSLYLLKSGVWRAYFNNDGKEDTVWFVQAGEAGFSTWGYVEGRPSRFTIEATCDSSALRYGADTLERIFDSSKGLSIWGRKLFEQILLSMDQWLVDISQQLAKDRYIALIEKMPEISQNVPLKDIAGFLNITPQSLSRIRAELVKKK